MRRIHHARWDRAKAQEQRAAEKSVCDQKKEAAAVVYKTFKDLSLDIIVDVSSFTVSALPEPDEIIIPDPRTGSSPSEEPKPLLVALAPYTRPALKIRARIPKTGTPASAERKDRHLHSDNIFKRFTVPIVGFFEGRFVWTRRKPDPAEAEHNKRVSENYVFDDVLGYHIPRSEFEKRATFNSDDVNPILDEITRLPARPVNKQPDINHDMGLTPTIPPEQVKENTYPKLRPPGFRSINDRE